ncbi:hypothetical protein AAAC51_19190 [Priestia megaterium]
MEDDLILMEMLPHPRAVSPEQATVEKNKREREQRLQETLSPIEKDVFALYMKGQTYMQISQDLHLSQKQ